MRNAILMALVVLSFTACAQRLQMRPKAGAAAGAEKAKADSKDQLNVDEKKKKTVLTDDQKKMPIETVNTHTPGAEIEQATLGPSVDAKIVTGEAPVAQTLPAPTTDKVSNCSVDFAALSEQDAADVMSKIGGSWIEGGINTVRNVVPSSDTSDIKRTVIDLGAKNEENAISRLTFKQAQEITPGKSPYEVVRTEKLAQAVSYRVSAPVEGFHLVELVTSSSPGTVQCTTFGFKFEAGPAKAQDALHSIGPAKDSKLSTEEFFTTFKSKVKIYTRQ
jgi:hypothetical protein